MNLYRPRYAHVNPWNPMETQGTQNKPHEPNEPHVCVFQWPGDSRAREIFD